MHRHTTFIRRAIRIAGSALALGAMLSLSQPAAPTEAAAGITVTTTADSGPGSLREAIIAANAAPKKDTIKFAIPGSGPHTITVTSPLPDIVFPVVIDTSKVPTFPGTLPIRLNGGNTVNNGLVLAAGSDGSTIKGLAIYDFNDSGMYVNNSTKHTIQGNFFGTPDGAVAASNQWGLFLSNADNNKIGGLTPNLGNLMSGNSQHGLVLTSGSSGNTVTGNRIGVNAAGSAILANAQLGIEINGGSNDNVIGGTAAGARNIISGNTSGGMTILGGSTGTKVQGNYIGTDATGKLDRGNGDSGIEVNVANNTIIGGTQAGAGNLISGNGFGVFLWNGSTGSVVQGNLIGTDVTGTLDLGNGLEGVTLLGAPNSTVGGPAPGARNIISGNDGSGVAISFLSGGSVVQGNLIGTDATATLDLDNDVNGVFINSTSNISVGGAAPGTGNVIRFNDNDGVKIQGSSSGIVVQRNWIDYSGFVGISLLDSATITTNTMNCITNNSTGMDNTTGVSTIAEGNWWGHPTGPSGAGPGSGDPVTVNVDFAPWSQSSCGAVRGEQVTDGGFEVDTGSDFMPDNWVGTKLVLGLGEDGQVCNVQNSGLCAFAIEGNNQAKKLTQTIFTSGAAGDDITLSLYSWETGVPSGGMYQVTATITYVGGGSARITLPLPTGTSGIFAQHSAPVLTTTKAYSKIVVVIDFRKSSGFTILDDVSITAAP